jgi:hypothetical protein
MGTRLGSPEVRKYKIRAAEKFGLRCYFCKNPFTLDQLTLEHLIPVGRGGSARSADNHALACFECNNSKSGLTVEEYCKVYRVNPSLLFRKGALRADLTETLPITNHVDLARLGLIG